MAQDFPLGKLRNELAAKLKTHPMLSVDADPPLGPLLAALRKLADEMSIRDALTQFAQTIPPEFTVGNTIRPDLDKLNTPTIQPLLDSLMDYLLTGAIAPAPKTWQGGVFTVSPFGDTIVAAAATQVTNPKEIIAQFRARMTKEFGDEYPKLSPSTIQAAGSLRTRAYIRFLRDCDSYPYYWFALPNALKA